MNTMQTMPQKMPSVPNPLPPEPYTELEPLPDKDSWRSYLCHKIMKYRKHPKWSKGN